MAADQKVRTYDPKKVVVTWGPIIIEGFAEGTFITIARNGDLFEKVKGADGTVDRINRNANDFMVTMMLKQTAVVNDLISAVVSSDVVSNTGIYPLVVKDLNGTSLFVAPQAWVGKDPDDEFADSLTNREWRFDTGAASKFTGGNN